MTKFQSNECHCFSSLRNYHEEPRIFFTSHDNYLWRQHSFVLELPKYLTLFAINSSPFSLNYAKYEEWRDATIRWENTHGTTHSEISHGQMTNVHIFSTLFLTDFLAVYFRTEKGGVQPKTSSGLLPNDILAWASVSQKK